MAREGQNPLSDFDPLLGQIAQIGIDVGTVPFHSLGVIHQERGARKVTKEYDATEHSRSVVDHIVNLSIILAAYDIESLHPERGTIFTDTERQRIQDVLSQTNERNFLLRYPANPSKPNGVSREEKFYTIADKMSLPGKVTAEVELEPDINASVTNAGEAGDEHNTVIVPHELRATVKSLAKAEILLDALLDSTLPGDTVPRREQIFEAYERISFELMQEAEKDVVNARHRVDRRSAINRYNSVSPAVTIPQKAKLLLYDINQNFKARKGADMQGILGTVLAGGLRGALVTAGFFGLEYYVASVINSLGGDITVPPELPRGDELIKIFQGHETNPLIILSVFVGTIVALLGIDEAIEKVRTDVAQYRKLDDIRSAISGGVNTRVLEVLNRLSKDGITPKVTRR